MQSVSIGSYYHILQTYVLLYSTVNAPLKSCTNKNQKQVVNKINRLN